MATKEDTGTQYGTRYGARNRIKAAMLERQYRISQKCPSCRKMSVRRLSVGIFECNKCGSKFTGRAYTTESSKLTEDEV